MPQERVNSTAINNMKQGNNCCQAVVIAACQEWGLPIPEEVLAAGAFFGGGMQAGCTCGALTGMIMASGLRSSHQGFPPGQQPAKQLHDIFKQEFGSACCRVIKKKHGIIDNIGMRACQELTGRATVLLIEYWEELNAKST